MPSLIDAIDIGNNKKALQEVEKVLKKTPNLSTALALKSLALIRLGREKESQSLIENLELAEPDDDSTLQVLTYCYRELNQLERICKVYHNAAKKQPGNDEILSMLNSRKKLNIAWGYFVYKLFLLSFRSTFHGSCSCE